MEASVGSKKAAEERARLMLKNLKLDEEKAQAGSKMDKTEKKVMVLQNPVRRNRKFQFPIGSSAENVCGKCKAKDAGIKRRRKKVTLRLGKEYVDFLEETPLTPLFQPYTCYDMRINEVQKRFVARQKAELEERNNILKQYEEQGYAEVEIEVTDEEEED